MLIKTRYPNLHGCNPFDEMGLIFVREFLEKIIYELNYLSFVSILWGAFLLIASSTA